MGKTFSLSDPRHTFIIAEAGSNWKSDSTYDDDLNQAKQLIKIASHCGADAVKFQTFRSETLYTHNAGISDYLAKEGMDISINDIFENLSMPYDMIPELSKFCQESGIFFMSTPFSVDDAKQIDPYVHLHKIASYEINHVRLLEYLGNIDKPILISTGASTLSDIDFAINSIKQFEPEFALMQCTSKYPSQLESLNLSVIPNLKKLYKCPIGFSDHSLDPVIGPLLAVGYGATIIEKHFTIDRKLPGPDHKFALIPNELEYMINSIRNADLAKGTGIKEILPVENELGKFAKRALQSTKDILQGVELIEGINFDILRPGNRIQGISPKFLKEINGKHSKKFIKKGDGIVEYE